MSWSSSDNFFVNAKLEVFSVDIFSEPLELTRSKRVVYDGPKGDDFMKFLRSKNFRVNRQGKAIVCVQKRNGDGEFLERQYDTFVLETVVPLSPFGFQNVPLPKPQEVIELQILLENTKVELVKKNDELTELQRLQENTKSELAKKNDALIVLENTKDELAKKNDELNELQSLQDNIKDELVKKNDALNKLMKQKIDQDWNREQFRLTMIAITNSMKRVFIDFGLEPPANGDPESVLRFLEMLRDLILHKEFGATFLVAANKLLASIESIFEKRNGISIGMETTNSTPSTPARLIESLFTLRGFMESHFFIDGSVIVRDFRLMNEYDLPVILRDSAADVAELRKKEVGAKSIDNIDEDSIFYGYFNIPKVGMFKGVLTRVHATLPDEIMVKLHISGKHNIINDKRFWFVFANGSAMFEKELLSPQDAKFAPSRVLGDPTDCLEFFRRMNRTFVNEKGTYLKFEFITAKLPRMEAIDFVGYYNKDLVLKNPFKLVQFDKNEPVTDIVKRDVFFPGSYSFRGNDGDATMIADEALDCAFTFKDFCFIGKITKTSGTFRMNALVSVFFEQTQHGQNCYVDDMATTFFVLKTEKIPTWNINGKRALEFIE
ncbi:uncharacterized protein LOC122065665 [Macadamia integrifolia]|uniref:uncharacterized protein LOC122065665 n=1 Tax=Macadamia integrifolia TaxID=60698 RepID=UPI001C4E3A21|nr:uncharacterized protein LOC122065665 [Macadamia integrifolia]